LRNDPIHTPTLVETEPAYAETDHMGRRHAATVGEAFRQDLPWILGLVGLLVFMIGALAGFWGR